MSSQERSFARVTLLWFSARTMCCEDFLVVFCLSLLTVERLNEGWDFNYGVVGPLIKFLAEERGVGTCGFVAMLGGHCFFLHEGKPVLVGGEWCAWDFDATRGFPGEDIYVLL